MKIQTQLKKKKVRSSMGKSKPLGQVWVNQNLTQHNLSCLESRLNKKTNIMIIYLVLF